jgi:hypothetical protein
MIMTEKNAYINDLTSGCRFTYPADVTNALRVFKKQYRYATPDGISWLAHMFAREQGMQELINAFTKAYAVAGVTVAARQLSEAADSLSSYYNDQTRTIVMVGKLSIVTLLHEFAHALLGRSERDAQEWSINLFKAVYPIAFDNLSAPAGHVLQAAGSRRAAPAPMQTIGVTVEN